MRVAAIAALWMIAVIGRVRADTYDMTLPRGSRVVIGDRYTSGKGLRDTYEHVARDLDRRGVGHRRVGPYRVRGVDVVRFLVDDVKSPVLAVHVYRVEGKTMIFFVKRST